MQGLGKPGVHQLCMIDGTFIAAACLADARYRRRRPGAWCRLNVQGGLSRVTVPLMPKTKQIIPKTMIHDAILDGHFEIYGSSDQMSPAADQFQKYIYPVKGCSRNTHDMDRYALPDDLLE